MGSERARGAARAREKLERAVEVLSSKRGCQTVIARCEVGGGVGCG